MAKERLDALLVNRGLFESRTRAQAAVMAGQVLVNEQKIDKPGTQVSPDVTIRLLGDKLRYVSRGGLKLEKALRDFGVDPTGYVCSDSGASTGGFTDCLLSYGARHVIAVDSGSGQLKESLRADPRVTTFENYNARNMKPEDFHYTPTFAVMDVSFISATYIISAVYDVLSPDGDFICLIKPQFEVGRSGLGKGGIVKDKSVRDAAVARVTDFATDVGFELLGLIISPILGGDGNTEFLAHFKKR